jgi:formiminotetrahydrofolate cyclodeaminase
VRDQSIGSYLDDLSAKIPAPGGGAAAAVHLAQAAALVAMVARYTTGPKYAEHAEFIEQLTAKADELRDAALDLARLDAEAFQRVADAYRLAKGPERTARIAEATAGAAEPPARTIEKSSEVLALAEQWLPIANPNGITDVAAAAEAARAAAATSRVNIEINLRGIADAEEARRYRVTAAEVDGLAARADAVTATVREGLA